VLVAPDIDRSWLDTAGHQHSDKLHVSEAFAKTGPDTITWTATFDDPVYFTKPWTICGRKSWTSQTIVSAPQNVGIMPAGNPTRDSNIGSDVIVLLRKKVPKLPSSSSCRYPVVRKLPLMYHGVWMACQARCVA
jgi:hypothetical protein